MISNLISHLDKYWEVENRPRNDLSKLPDAYFIDVKRSNVIVICIVIFSFTITAVFIGAGAFS